MNLLTILVCAYLALAGIRGCWKGCVRTVISMLMLVAVIVLTMLLTPLMSKVVAGSAYVRTWYTATAESFLSAFVNSSGQVDLTPLNIGGNLSNSPFQAAAAVLTFLLSASGAPALTTERLVGFMIGVTAMVITFVLVFLAFIIIRIIVGHGKKKGGVRIVDHILGLPLGLAKGLIVVWIFLGVLNLLAFVPQVRPVAMQITDSPILSFLNEHNLIVRGIIRLIGA